MSTYLKHILRTFYYPPKSEDKLSYAKAKIHSYNIFTHALGGIFLVIFALFSGIQLLFQGDTPYAWPLVVALINLGGLRLKSYRVLKYFNFVWQLMTPIIISFSPTFFAIPFFVIFCNQNVLLLTRSRVQTMIHLAVHVAYFYFCAIPKLAAHMQSMSATEIANSFMCQMNVALQLVVMHSLGIQRFDYGFNRLLQKSISLKRNLDTVNYELHEKNVQLEKSLELKEVFIYTFSHELKNALNGLLGNLALAFDDVTDKQVANYLSNAKVCGEVLKNFIHNILDSGKLENGNLEVVKTPKDVTRFMQNLWGICGQIIANKRLEGRLRIAPNVPRYLELDSQRLLQILLNLTSNAVKFTQKGYVNFNVSWEAQKTEKEKSLVKSRQERGNQILASGDFSSLRSMQEFRESEASDQINIYKAPSFYFKFFEQEWHELNFANTVWPAENTLGTKDPPGTKGILKIQVSDTGCGIKDDEIKQLFQRFSQVNPNPEKRKIGTGLGLWICKELTQRLGGDITVKSMPNVGSIFEVVLHTQVSEPNAFNSTIKSMTWLPTATSPHKSKFKTHKLSTLPFGLRNKVLIADDDNFNMELMKNYLTKMGLDFICAYDGEELVTAYLRNYSEVVAIITDNNMPNKDGIDAAKEITTFIRQRGIKSIPILCVTGDVRVHLSDEAGITGLLSKPVDYEQIKQELSKVIPQLAVQ